MITLKKILEDRKITQVYNEHSFSDLPDIYPSIQLLDSHIKLNHNIWILWDFDTDWIAATSSFILWLQELYPTTNFFYLVPERSEGHGFNKNTIDYMKSKDVKLIISCDNASNDIDLIKYWRSLGIEFIITDHHQVTIEDRDYLLVNPERKDSVYPYSHLCWATVVYKFLQGVEVKVWRKISTDTMNLIKILVSIATIADMVLLNDENLFLVKQGYNLLLTTNSPFFKELKNQTMFDQDNGLYYGWTLWPFFNCAWRLEKSNFLIKIIIEQNTIWNLKELIRYFLKLNDYRKSLTKEWNQTVKDSVIRTKYVNLILHNDLPVWLRRLVWNEYLEWKVSFCGGVNKCNSNIIDCSVSNTYDLDLLPFLRESSFTVEGGGHKGAFGYSYYKDKEKEFLDSLNKYIEDNIWDISFTKNEDRYDYELTGYNYEESLIQDISRYIWWQGLEEPLFKLNGVVYDKKLMKDTHLKLKIRTEINWKIQDFEIVKWYNTELEKYDYDKEYSFIWYIWVNNFLWKKTYQMRLI